ncbi:MAG: DUF4294 domain-containing protein [Bacteroidota bacterium]
MRYKIAFTLCFLLNFACAWAQEPRQIVVLATIVGEDTIPLVNLAEVIIYAHVEYRTIQQEIDYQRLVRNVRKVLPYSKLASVKISEFNAIISNISNEKAKDKRLKEAEKELKDQFEDDIKDFTDTQGKIFIKLIYRQTGNSSYEVIKKLRGSFNAFVWQTLAKMFGYNLKEEYDPSGKDKDLEIVVKRLENGEL